MRRVLLMLPVRHERRQRRLSACCQCSCADDADAALRLPLDALQHTLRLYAMLAADYYLMLTP